MKKIVLVNPYSKNVLSLYRDKQLNDNMGVYPPIGLLYIASYIKAKMKDIEVKVIDCIIDRINDTEFIDILKVEKPDILGVTAYSSMIIDVYEICENAKKIDSNIVTVVGGPHVDVFAYETLLNRYVDFTISHEAEESFFRLVSKLRNRETDFENVDGVSFKRDGKIVKNRIFPKINDLDSLPPIDWDLINVRKYSLVIGSTEKSGILITSRGCPFSCTFCYLPVKSYRFMSPEKVLRDIKSLMRYGIKEFFFFDEMFTVRKDRVINICKLILKEKLKIKFSFRTRIDRVDDELLYWVKRAGCNRIHLGIETSSDRKLKILNKKITIEQIKRAVALIKRYRIATVGSFMLGIPYETKKSAMKTIKFAKYLNLDYAQFSEFTLMPKTKSYIDAFKEGILKDDVWKEYAKNPSLDFKPPIWNQYFTRDELRKLVIDAHKMYYYRVSYIIKSITKLMTFKQLKDKFIGAVKLLLIR